MGSGFALPMRLFFSVVLIGGALGLGQAPFGLWFVSLLALLGALFGFGYVKSTASAFTYGWGLGLGYFLLTLRWIVEPFLIEADRYGWMAPFALFLLASGMALFWAFSFAISYRVAERSIWSIVAFLSAAEIARSLVLTGFPWALLGHIWIDTPIAQLSALVGPHGLTLITLGLSGSIFLLLKRRWQYVVFPIVFVFSWFAIQVPILGEDPSRPVIRIVQPNVAQTEKWDPAHKVVHLNRLIELSQGGAETPDLVVWPETALAQLIEFAQPSIDSISDSMAGVPVISGIQRRVSDNIYHNSMILIGRGGEINAVYDKRHLVPFGEYFPGGELAARLGLAGFASSQGAGFSKGATDRLVEIPSVGLARALICYEGIFAEEISAGQKRASMMILITNDAWFGESAGPQQHLVQARFRAIEQGLPMIRSANTGISAMIDPYGRIIQALGLGQASKIDARLPSALSTTIYARFGDWPAIFSCLILACFVCLRRNCD